MKKKWLAVGIILLFIGVSFQPIIAEKTKIISVENESSYANVDFDEAKEYLFQTLIAISNNQNVKELLKQNNHKAFNSDYDYKDVFLQILFKKPRLLKSMLFTKPKMTYEYLETNYNRGLELYNILGKEESLKIIESVKIVNPEFFNELNNIILNDKELYDKILTLGEINEILKSISYNMSICIILFICFLTSAILGSIICLPYFIFKELADKYKIPILCLFEDFFGEICVIFSEPFAYGIIISYLIGKYYSCW